MADFAQLQRLIRIDADSYLDEFLEQLRHFEAAFQIFKARPDESSKEFTRLVRFVASVADAYPKETSRFVLDLMELLEKNYEALDKDLRKALVQSLMQLRKRRRVELIQLLPLFFRLFGCKDKPLRHMIFGFLVSDIRTAEKVQRQHQHNRQIKGFLFNILRDNNVAIAKKALAILTDLWRRQIWQDVHTANVIASALLLPDLTVVYAAVKFFLGYDLKECEEDDEDDEEMIHREAQLCNEDVYKAQKKGTRSSRKKKVKKLRRLKSALRRQARKERLEPKEQFAAIQLLQDPYGIADTLFSLSRSGKMPVQTRLATIKLLSRIISVHQLVMVNFYPYLQRYLVPNGRDILTILAALVEGCHEMVPPDIIMPVLRQLVNAFVHDHARPEVITMGLKTVREMCSRAPMIMTEELLSDLVLYYKFKDKDVRAAAKGLITLFREIAPQMLPRKDRGRSDAIMKTEPLVFGQTQSFKRLDGAELLEKEREEQMALEPSDSENELDSKDFDEVKGNKIENEETKNQTNLVPDPNSLASLKKRLASLKRTQTSEEMQEISEDDSSIKESDLSDEKDSLETESLDHEIDSNKDDLPEINSAVEESDSTEDDLSEINSSVVEPASSEDDLPKIVSSTEESGPIGNSTENRSMMENESLESVAESIPLDMPRVPKKDVSYKPIEMTEILDDEDFQRLKELRREQAVKLQLKKFGISRGTEKNTKLIEAAEIDADEMLKRTRNRTHVSEMSLDPTELLGKKRKKADKEERMLSILRGREDEEGYASKSAYKKRKRGGSSNKEKIKRKQLPLKGRIAQAKKRRKRNAIKRKGKNFKGHVKKH